MGRRRIRNAAQGMTNSVRWKSLTASGRLPLSHASMRRSASATALKQNGDANQSPLKSNIGQLATGYDIDGDGFIDAREMKLAQRLHEIVVDQTTMPTVDEMNQLRQKFGRTIFAEEFVTRNKIHLWRYGDILAGKTPEEAVCYIANHPDYNKLMTNLENIERQREVRSSRGARQCFQQLNSTDPKLQTWVQTTRKHRMTSAEATERREHEKKMTPDYDYQLENRRKIAKEFITRNNGDMWKYDVQYAGKTDKELTTLIASQEKFDEKITTMKGKERVFQLKSSRNVAACLVDPRLQQFVAVDPPTLTTRAVRCRSELLKARQCMNKQELSDNRVRIQPISIPRSTSAAQLHRPHLFPVHEPIQPLLDLSITKWKLK